MEVIKKNVVSLLQKHTYLDAWFPFRYSLEVESGCGYECRFCRVNWPKNSYNISNGADKLNKKVIQKANLFSLLNSELKELNKTTKQRRQKHFIGLGGGYNEIFSRTTNNIAISKKVLWQLMETGHKPFVLTRTDAIHSAMDMLIEYQQEKASNLPVIAFSLCSVDENICAILEPDVPTANKRFAVASDFIDKGISVGLCLMPVVPMYGDSDFELKLFVSKASALRASFVLFSMIDFSTLKHLINTNFFTQLELEKIAAFTTTEEVWKEYCAQKEMYFIEQCALHKLPPLLPHEVYSGYLSLKDEITVVLLQAYYYSLYLGKKRDGFRFASYSLNRLTEGEFQKFLTGDDNIVKNLVGVGNFIFNVIVKMKTNKKADFLEKMCADFFIANKPKQ